MGRERRYAPTKYAATLSDLDKVLRAVQGWEALETAALLCKNAALCPKEAKYRRVRLANGRVARTIGATAGAVEAMLALGWERRTEATAAGTEEAVLVLPEGAKVTMEQVRAIEENKDWVKRELDRALRTRATGGGRAVDPTLKAQLEADKQERAAAEPVTKSSKNQGLGPGQMMTAADAGIGCSSSS